MAGERTPRPAGAPEGRDTARRASAPADPVPGRAPDPATGRAATATAGRGTGLAWGLGWALAAALTRVPWSGRSLGESDCARYLVGIAQWLRLGSHAPLVYAKVMSPGYYALMVALVRHAGVAPVSAANALSLAAAVASAPLLFALGRRLTHPPVAAAATALYLLSPAYWWLGIEPHPQGVSFFFLLLALWALLRAQAPAPYATAARRAAWYSASAAALTAGLLLKNDLLLLFGAFPALAAGWGQSPRGRGEQASRGSCWGRMLAACGVVATAAGGFVLGRGWVLGLSWGQVQQLTDHAVGEFFGWPTGAQLLKQVLPMVTGPGVATFAVVGAGVVLGLRAAAWRRRWGWALAAWVGPGTVFWFLLRGNNARHMAPYLLLPLWAAGEGWQAWFAGFSWQRWPVWQRWQGWPGGPAAWRGPRPGNRPGNRLGNRPVNRPVNRWTGASAPGAGSAAAPARRAVEVGAAVAVAVAVVVGLNWVLVPASSNPTLYPAADVPASVADLAQRSAELAGWMAARQAASPAGTDAAATPCYLGNYTLPYLEWNGLRSVPGSVIEVLTLPPPAAHAARWLTARGGARFVEVNSPAEYQRAAQLCGPAWSLEYAADGAHRRFLGEEWRGLPLARRWYPAAAP